MCERDEIMHVAKLMAAAGEALVGRGYDLATVCSGMIAGATALAEVRGDRDEAIATVEAVLADMRRDQAVAQHGAAGSA